MKRLLELLRTLWTSVAAVVAIVLIVAAFVLGLSLGGPGDAGDAGPGHAASQPSATVTEYTCSMHPQIRLPDPDAKCPICFMALIPVAPDRGADEGERVLVMTPAAAKLAEIRTTPVVRMYPEHTVRLFGNIDHDETRVATIAAYFPGRLDRLYVDYTGIPVRAGDHLVSIYSPELMTTEAELVTLSRNLERMRGSVTAETLRSVESTVEGAREKLRLWGLTPAQIRAIEETGETPDRLTIYSPMGGIVIQKHKVTGDYVKTGDPIFSVADFSHLWLRLDAYESDLRWLRHGQPVEFTAESFPGEVFTGQISFLDPEVSPITRTAKIRVNVDNSDRRLKPGMFVRAVVTPVVGSAGEVIAEEMAGRWVCPMHPEVVKDEEGQCDLCGMDLVAAETLGYVSAEATGRAPLVIPASAPMITGRRAVVYVRLPNRERPTFEGREIVLGARAGDYYMVREDVPGGANLAEGESIVLNGAFKIDSALQIAAKPSMMDAEAPGAPAGAPATVNPSVAPRLAAASAGFLSSLTPIYDAYFVAQEALARDDIAQYGRGREALRAAVGDVDEGALVGAPRLAWRRLSTRLTPGVAAPGDLATARVGFDALAKAIIDLERQFGHLDPATHYISFCPMAFGDRGAEWLARVRQINNPYFGSSMLRCGEVRGEMPPRPAESTPARGGES